MKRQRGGVVQKFLVLGTGDVLRWRLGVNHLDIVLHRRNLVHEATNRRSQLGIEYQQLDPGMVQDVGDLSGSQPGVQGHQYGTKSQWSEVGFQHRRKVRHQKGHPVPFFDTAFLECSGQPHDPLVKLGIGNDLLPINNGRLFRVNQGATLQKGQGIETRY